MYQNQIHQLQQNNLQLNLIYQHLHLYQKPGVGISKELIVTLKEKKKEIDLKMQLENLKNLSKSKSEK